jgi:hypothetical protein
MGEYRADWFTVDVIALVVQLRLGLVLLPGCA